MTKKEILELVEQEDVEFIRLQFTDMFGNLKNVAVTANQLERVLENKYVFEGSALFDEFKESEEDFYLHPDFNTFVILPWRPQQGKVARLLCDVYYEDKTPCNMSPRIILKNVLAEAKKKGYDFYIDPECEFFLFHSDEDGIPTTLTHEQAGYMDVGPIDLGENARRDMVMTLEEMGFEIESSHHEKAPAQHQVDFKYDEALTAADNIMTFKLAVKMVAKRHGLHATFMPKPKFGVDGSGMHLSMSLMKEGKNVFYDPDGELGLSKDAYYFMAGIMKHIKAITAITNPLVNSYKRLVPGFCAPTTVGWSSSNENSLFGIPYEEGENTRIELRIPDPTANPYLALAVCLMAGLKGMDEKQELPADIKKSVKSNRKGLPSSLMEAIMELERDTFIQDVLGKELCKYYIDLKKAEWQDYTSQITEWEIARYLDQY